MFGMFNNHIIYQKIKDVEEHFPRHSTSNVPLQIGPKSLSIKPNAVLRFQWMLIVLLMISNAYLWYTNKYDDKKQVTDGVVTDAAVFCMLPESYRLQ